MNTKNQNIFRGYLTLYVLCGLFSLLIGFEREGFVIGVVIRGILMLLGGMVFFVAFFYHVLNRKPISYWAFHYEKETSEDLRIFHLLISGCGGLLIALYELWI